MTKCCPIHPAAVNRTARRLADRCCSCRGECGSHPTPRKPQMKETHDG